ncbi:NUDIX domain-containing protein [Candidatus Collierbacteria bacterium]|nr:NUDIX domain-containing protein [Candidatus Collierbacteria bacterium]
MPHIHDLINFTVAAYIVNNGKVVLVNHLQLKRWMPVGGHIELDEDPEEALFREIKEEAGIDKRDLTVLSNKPEIVSDGTKFLFTPSFLDIHKITDTHRHVGIIYLLSSKTDELVLAADEHNGIRWFGLSELENEEFKISPAVKFYAEEAIKLSNSSGR